MGVLTETRREVTVPVLECLVADDSGKVYAVRLTPGLWSCDCTEQRHYLFNRRESDLAAMCEHLREVARGIGDKTIKTS